MKNINVQSLKVNEEQFFKVWLMMLQPFLKIRKQEMDILAKLLYSRYLISQQVTNQSIVDDLLFNAKNKKRIKQELGIQTYSFNNVIASLKKKKIIINNSINKKIIPQVQNNFKNFKLVYDIEVVEK